MEVRLRLTRTRVAMLVVIAAVIGAGVAYAAIPDSNGLMTACVLKNRGLVRLIDPALPSSNYMSHCDASTETAVTWSQAGQQGIQGPQGNQGPQGPQGPAVKISDLATTQVNGDSKDFGCCYDFQRATAVCPSGSLATGGGYYFSGSDIAYSRQYGNGWEVGGWGGLIISGSVTAYVTCLSVK